MMFRLTIAQLAAHRRRLVATAAAVVAGVAFLSGTLVLTDTIGHTLDGVLADANAGTDAYVRAPNPLDSGFGQPRPGLPADLVDTVAATDGVAAAAPRIRGYAQLVGPDGEPVGDPDGAPLWGEAWVDVPELNPYHLVDGREPAVDDEVVIDRGTADETGFAPGDVTTVLSASEPTPVTIVGIARFGDADSAAGAHSVLFTQDAAEQLVSTPGEVDGIAVVAEGSLSQDELVERLAPVMGDNEVLTGAALTAEDQGDVREMFSLFDTFMLVFAGIALFVGAFIINNTFSMLVAQRSRETALLRALGAERGQVLRSVVVESAAIGATASAVGLGAGIGVALGLRSLLGTFGFDIPAGPLVVSTTAVVVSLATGVGVTVLSAVLPARRASRVAPVAALRDAAVEPARPRRRRLVAGAVVTGGGVAAVLAGLGGAGVPLVGLGAVATFLGVSVLGPAVAPGAVRLLGAPLPRLRGVAGRMATENARRSPLRTSRTASALMIGVGLVTFITILAASTRTSVASTVEHDFAGNYVVDSGGFGDSGISPELADRLREEPGVVHISENRLTRALVDGTAEDYFSAFDPSTIGQLFDLGDVQGDLAGLGDDGLAVEADTAAERGWALGDVVEVTFVDGAAPFTVRAVFDRSEQWVGSVWTSVAAFDAHAGSTIDSRLYLDLDPDSGAVAAVEAAVADYPSAALLDRDGFVDQFGSEVDQILGLVYVLLALAIAIAVIGIANTMGLSIVERTRELGLLRAVGMTRAQLRATVRWESAVIAGFGVTGGLGVGVFFGWAMVRALASEGIDQLTLPAPQLAVIAAVGVAAGVAAAVLPARRAARLDVLDAIATA